MKSVSRTGLGRRSIAVVLTAIVAVVLLLMTLPPGPAVLAALGLGIVAGGLVAAFPTESDWLRFLSAIAVAYSARFVAARWSASEGWQTVAIIFVAVGAFLVSGEVFARVRRRFSVMPAKR